MARPLVAKAAHEQALLHALLRCPNATKPQLCRFTRLPPSAVHPLMAAMEERGIVREAGCAPSDGGRPALCYRLSESLGVLAAVNIRPEQTQLGLFDTGGNPLAFKAVTAALTDQGPESYTGELAQVLSELLSTQPQKRCYGVGVTVPGPVDVENGVVMQLSTAPELAELSLAARLQAALHLPVAIDKDVYAAAHALVANGRIAPARCAVYLSIDEGISSAVMIEGKVFRGTHSLAGEIGHLTVRRDGIPCSCGNTGCVELYCSDKGIVSQYNEQAGTRYTELDAVLSLLSKEDAVSVKIFSQAVRYLADAASTLFMTYDPDVLVLCCRWLSARRELYCRFLDYLYTKNMFTKQYTVDVSLCEEPPTPLSPAMTLAQSRLLISAAPSSHS